MKVYLAFFLAIPFLTFAAEKYGIYDLQGNRISTFEAEPYELPEKMWQIKGDNLYKKLYVSSAQRGRNSKPTSSYQFKTGSYIEATRNETFSICPPDDKTDGTWISEHSVALNEKNCLSVQAPNLAGTFRVLFMENSGLMDTIQILVDQSYIQMGDYSHKMWVPSPEIEKLPANQYSLEIIWMYYGEYKNISYKQNLIVDKTKFIVSDAWHYSKIDTSIASFESDLYLKWKYENVNLGESKLPFAASYTSFMVANLRSKMEGLDTAYTLLPLKKARKLKEAGKIILPEERTSNYYKGESDDYIVVALDTSASGYRTPLEDEWHFLMRAGTSTHYYWGNEEDSLTVSKYAWYPPPYRTGFGLKPVELLVPNAFGLYGIMDFVAREDCGGGIGRECYFLRNHSRDAASLLGFRLLRKTPKLHKLEKF